MAGILNQANWSYFVQKDLSHHFATEYTEFDSMIPALFAQKEPDQAADRVNRN